MKSTVRVLLPIVALSAWASGGWVDLGGGAAPSPPSITLVENSAEGCRYHVVVPGFYLDTIAVQEGVFTSISLPEASYLMEAGNPELPTLVVSSVVPNAGDVLSVVVEPDVVSLDVLPVIPSKGSLSREVDPDSVPYSFSDTYQSGQWYPVDLGDQQEPFLLCDYRGVTVLLNVFRHNPVEGKLEVAREFDLVLTFQIPTAVYRDSIAAGFAGIYQSLFRNFSWVNFGYTRKLRMTIICADEFYEDVLPLRTWKMKKGIDTRVVGLGEITNPLDPDTAEIRSFIHDQRFGPDQVTCFLLVGDHEQLPSLRAFDDPFAPPADPRYVVFNPPYPSAFVGRLSGNSSQEIASQVDKILWFERLPVQQPPAWPWTRSALVMASRQSGPRRTADSTYKNLMRDDLLQRYWQADKLYDCAASPGNITVRLDEGTAFVNFLHGPRGLGSMALRQAGCRPGVPC